MINCGIIFLGPPGAGKGTQAAILATNLSIPHISTGEILRSAITSGTPLGQQAQTYVDRGDLVPDDLILDLIRERLQQSDAQRGWILDGFPRSVSQAIFLDKLLYELDQACNCVISLQVPAEVIIQRLLQRGRKDDTYETIANRLNVYQQQTAPVIGYYHERGNLYSVDGNRTLEQVGSSLKELVQKRLPDLQYVQN